MPHSPWMWGNVLLSLAMADNGIDSGCRFMPHIIHRYAAAVFPQQCSWLTKSVRWLDMEVSLDIPFRLYYINILWLSFALSGIPELTAIFSLFCEWHFDRYLLQWYGGSQLIRMELVSGRHPTNISSLREKCWWITYIILDQFECHLPFMSKDLLENTVLCKVPGTHKCPRDRRMVRTMGMRLSSIHQK